MSETISITLRNCWLGYTVLGSMALSTSAVSPDAKAVSRAALDLVGSTELSQVLFGSKSAALSRLRALANECAEDGWDASGGSALDPLAIRNAETFLRVLPDSLLQPEIAPEPDGSVSLDWIVSRHRLLSLSIGASNRISYAWLDGADKGHAVASFDGVTVPQRVLQALEVLIPHEHADFQAA